jgi:predicted nucleotide-binding protein
MARRTIAPPAQPAALTPEQMRQGVDRLKKRIEEVRAFDPTAVREQFHSPELDALSASIDESLVRTFGADSLDYSRYRSAAELDQGPLNMFHPTPIERVHEALARSKARNIALLDQAVATVEERLAETASEQLGSTNRSAEPSELSKKVFIVHGHDDGPKHAVARFLQALGLEPIILHEQASRGLTIIEKVEAHGEVDFAVVLMTPDDVGKAKDAAEFKPRARQNVVAELGYFVGRLKRHKVCALVRGEVEIPSDFAGVVYVTYDDGGAWKAALAKELQAVGYQFDWNAVMR